MKFRFRKSINLGGGFRVNLSKSGIGYSWGTKGVRYTKTAKGKKRTSLSIPGTGIFYTTEFGGNKRTSLPKSTKTTSNLVAPNPNDEGSGGKNMVWVKFIICLFLGPLGVHKFMEKKNGMGILYLFTMGLFGFGWIYDCIKYLIVAIKSTVYEVKAPVERCENNMEYTTEHPPVEIPEKRGFSIKKVLLWILTGFLGLIALAYAPHISGIIALATAAVVVPIEKWQNQITRFLKGKTKTAIVTVMTVVAFFATPTTDSAEVEPVNPDIASAVIAGEATIPSTADDAEIQVEQSVAVERIIFEGGSYTVGVGRTVDVPFTLYPENATSSALEAFLDNVENATLSFEKKDEGIIQITGLVPGEVKITLKSGEMVIATKIITVVEVMPEGIQIKAETETPQIESSGFFSVEFDPLDVTNQDVTWHSDAPEVIAVNEDGSYEALSIGEATITATHENGVIGTIQLTVIPVQVERIQLNTNWETGKQFYRGDTMTLTAEIFPDNAADKSIIWTSSDESVATVSDRGVVKAIAQGTAVITAEASNGTTSTYHITVDPSPQKFRVSVSIQLQSNDHVGSSWTTGFEVNDETIYSGTVVSIMPGDTFTVRGWAQDNDSKPENGSYWERLTLTNEMCQSGFTVEGEANVRENGGRYSGHLAVWYVKITFTPIN